MECVICLKYFRSVIDYQVHLKRHKETTENWSCNICNLDFISESSLLFYRSSQIHKIRQKQRRMTTLQEKNQPVEQQEYYLTNIGM